MGIVSGAALEKGGKVTGVVPYPMLVAGGEQDKTSPSKIRLNEKGREKVSLDDIPPFTGSKLSDCGS